LIYSTYLGGNSGDVGFGVALDSVRNAYVTGLTYSTNFPTTAGALQTVFGGSYDAFVSKLNRTGSALIYSTDLGGVSRDFAGGIAVDSRGNAYVTGQTYSRDFPITPGGLQIKLNSAFYNAFVSKLNRTGSALDYSTYLGGGGKDSGTGIAVDSAGNAYVTGWAYSSNFPITPGALQTVNAGVFVSKISFRR